MGLLTDSDIAPLKKWIVHRLENTSDADADVLADYVLALLRHEGSVETVRALCEHEIPDFLKEDSTSFVNDVFEAIHYKTYLPGAAMPPRRQSGPFAPPRGPSAPARPEGYGTSMGAPMGPANGNAARKRSWNDRSENEFQGNGDPNGRSYKLLRRGGPGGVGRGGYDAGRGGFDRGRGGFGGGPGNNFGPPPKLPGFPESMPGVPGLAWNSADPAGQIALLNQIMGFPPVSGAGMPSFPPAVAPSNRGGYRGHGGPPRRQRCRDYDIRGFCERGNTCLFEHGEHSIWVPPQQKLDEYDPTTSLSVSPATMIPNTNIPNIQLGRGRGRGRGMQDGRGQFSSNGRRGGRSELSQDGPNYDDYTNTKVVVENIPEESFEEATVREFFEEFGAITDITMKPYKRLAIVTYKTWESALAAYKSPKVIFDNRFVKVYWYKDADSLPQPPATGANGANGTFKNRLSSKPEGPVPARVTDEPEIDMEELTKKQAEAQKSHEERTKKKQAAEAMKKGIEEKAAKVEEEKRKMMEKIAAKSSKIMETSGSQSGIPAPEDKKAAQTAALKAQLAALEAEAESMGIDSAPTEETPSWAGGGRGRGRGRGRGGYIPRGYRGGYRGRGAAPFSAGAPRAFSLDNRPKKIGLTGVDFSVSDKEEALRTYLLSVGEYSDLDITAARTSVTFKERWIAEKFMNSGGVIPDAGKVEMAWIQTPLPPVNVNSTSSNTGTSTPIPTKAEKDEQDVTMGEDEDEAVAEQHQEPQQSGGNLDYDVAEGDDWNDIE